MFTFLFRGDTTAHAQALAPPTEAPAAADSGSTPRGMASQAVLKAVQTARFTQTRLLLQMGTEVNGRDAEGRTPLIHALQLQEPRVRTRFLRLLLKAGALVSAADGKSMNGLMWGCRLADSQDVRLLLHHADEDLDLNARNAAGQTALWIAVNGDKVDSVRHVLRALSKHELSSEVADHWGVTPAMRASTLGYLDCLRALIEHLDTMAKSNNTLINIAQINHILKSLSVVNKPPKVTSLSPRPQIPAIVTKPTAMTTSWSPRRPENPNTKSTLTPKLPSIQVVSADGYQPPICTHRSGHQESERGSSQALFSLEFFREPTRCSTPIAFTGPLLRGRSPGPLRSGQVSPIPSVSGQSRVNRSLRVMDTERRALTPDERRFPSKKISTASLNLDGPEYVPMQHQRSLFAPQAPARKISSTTTNYTESPGHSVAVNEHKRSTSTPPVSNPRGPSPYGPEAVAVGHPGRILLKSLGCVTMVRGSVRETLPGFFDVFAEQTSRSFRKAAVKPVPKIKKVVRLQVQKGSKWTKLRGVALLGRLAKSVKGGKGKPRAIIKPRKLSPIKQRDG